MPQPPGAASTSATMSGSRHVLAAFGYRGGLFIRSSGRLSPRPMRQMGSQVQCDDSL